MKFASTLLLNVVVVAAGLFVYDHWIATEDPLGDEALTTLDRQMKALRRRVPVDRARDARMDRVATIVEQMNLGLDDVTMERLLETLAGNFDDRQAFLDRKDLAGMSNQEFERTYRNVIEPYMNKVRILIKDPIVAEGVIKRFIYDGRPIVKPDLSKLAPPKSMNR